MQNTPDWQRIGVAVALILSALVDMHIALRVAVVAVGLLILAWPHLPRIWTAAIDYVGFAQASPSPGNVPSTKTVVSTSEFAIPPSSGPIAFVSGEMLRRIVFKRGLLLYRCFVATKKSHSIRGVQIELKRIVKCGRPFLFFVPELPRRLATEFGTGQIDLHPEYEAAFELCARKGDASAATIVFAPFSDGPPMELQMGRYHLTVTVSGFDVLPTTVAFQAELEEGGALTVHKLDGLGEDPVAVGNRMLFEHVQRQASESRRSPPGK